MVPSPFVDTIDDKVIEECAELIHAISKAKRFGYINYHPNTPDICNAKLILNEINDLLQCLFIFRTDLLPTIEVFKNNDRKQNEPL
jgi:phosphoribosyl-ATP pyrophosphohydrolase